MERILCAAIHFQDGKVRVHKPKNIVTGIVIAGHRHCNCINILAEMFGSVKDRGFFGCETQGFLTSQNRFVDRREAAKIALACGQITELKYFKDELDSSDLY